MQISEEQPNKNLLVLSVAKSGWEQLTTGR